ACAATGFSASCEATSALSLDSGLAETVLLAVVVFETVADLAAVVFEALDVLAAGFVVVGFAAVVLGAVVLAVAGFAVVVLAVVPAGLVVFAVAAVFGLAGLAAAGVAFGASWLFSGVLPELVSLI
ncbi:MAG: hypothetical protein DI548_15160, partial [Flavobacterium johnsoniae]